MHFTFVPQNVVDSLNAFVSMGIKPSDHLFSLLQAKVYMDIHDLRLDQLADILLAMGEFERTMVEHFDSCVQERACVLLEQNHYRQSPDVLARLVLSITSLGLRPSDRLIELVLREYFFSGSNNPLHIQHWWIFALHLVHILKIKPDTKRVGPIVQKLFLTLRDDPRAVPPETVSEHAREMARLLTEMGYEARVGERDPTTKYTMDVIYLSQVVTCPHVVLS